MSLLLLLVFYYQWRKIRKILFPSNPPLGWSPFPKTHYTHSHTEASTYAVEVERLDSSWDSREGWARKRGYIVFILSKINEHCLLIIIKCSWNSATPRRKWARICSLLWKKHPIYFHNSCTRRCFMFLKFFKLLAF